MYKIVIFFCALFFRNDRLKDVLRKKNTFYYSSLFQGRCLINLTPTRTTLLILMISTLNIQKIVRP